MSGLTETESASWYALDAAQVVRRMGSDAEEGLRSGVASERLASHGPNEIQAEAPPSKLQIAAGQVLDPMNLMLIAVAVVSIVIGEVSTGVVVGVLVALNVILGSRQEIKARAAVDALATLQVPSVRVVRDGTVSEVPATDVVPGDLVRVEAGDLVPADGRIIRSASLEVQEASLTGESAPIAKDQERVDADAELGDRSCMLYQNTSVTRGTGVIVIVATGMDTEMGHIAGMLSNVERKRSPLQRELDDLTKLLGFVAWGAVAVIVLIGLARGMPASDLLLLGTAMAISAIPTGLPTFVQGMLSYGSRQLSEAKAVVKNLTDVETLGSTSAINTDKTGTLTMNEMMVNVFHHAGDWYRVEGNGYDKHGTIRGVAGRPEHDFTSFGLALALDSDATVDDDGTVVGDPTEAALVVLAAKFGVDAEETRRAYPRLAEVPFDSAYKFMSTVHRAEIDGREQMILLTKGAPDVVLDRCSESVLAQAGQVTPIEQARPGIDAANERMGEEGLRVLSFAYRLIDPGDEAAVLEDPMAFVTGMRFVALIGMIDPLRPTSKHAVNVSRGAGIDVRMITGDHIVTAAAIGKGLGLGPGAISGRDFRSLSDSEVLDRLDGLHVFGRVTPDDKLRLVRLMQSKGMIVAMTGDAVNDAAALKQSDIGVAMGSGSEVTKQAAKMILTDDNFGTLVRAVELGRSIYQKISLYVRYQMSQLISLVLLFLFASAVDIANGVALTPMMVLFLNFFVASTPVVVILAEAVDPTLMDRPPRDPAVKLTNPAEVTRWLVYGAALFVATSIPLIWGPDTPLPDAPTVSTTMAYATMALGTLLGGLSMRRDPGSGLVPPAARALGVLAVPAVLTVVTTTWRPFQRLLSTQALTGEQWLAVLGLGLFVLAVVEIDTYLRARRERAGRTDA